VQIAREQARQEDLGALVADRVLVCDTDPFATEIWHERYVGAPSAEVAAIASGRKCDLYLLTGTDMPFVQDGFRDGENVREWMHRRFRDELERRGKPYVLLEGDHRTRLNRAIERIDDLLGLNQAG
jgi:nicotinamide riboside kinase